MNWHDRLRAARWLLAPPPRRPLQARSLTPLLAALGVGGAVVLYLTQTHRIQFANPNAFALVPVLVWAWWLHVVGYSGLSGARAHLALLLRLALLLIMIMVLAEPRAVRRDEGLALLYAVDLSDSVGQSASDAALRFVTRTAQEKPPHDQAGLVVFAREPAVELPPRRTFPFEAVNSQLSSDGTDLGRALSLAAAMLPENRHGHLVLVSDGSQTQGDVTTVLDDLRSRDIPVDVLPISYRHEHEVWLERLDLPLRVKLGETYEASVILSSLSAGQGRLVLRENDRVIASETVRYKAGKNRFNLPLYLREPGYYEYVARLEVAPDRDGWPDNNIAVNHLFLEGEGRVLMVTNPERDDRDWREVAAALKGGRRVVEAQPAYAFPRQPLALMPYDCVVFANVPADAFDAVQRQALHDAVYHQGTGFLMLGGEHSFGPGGYHRTLIEKALPVSMDITQKKVLPKGALAIILHTCEFPQGNTWAKRITKQAIKVLGAADEVGVLVYGFTGGEKWLFPLTPAGQYEELALKINQAEIGDMPSFATTMELGLKGLEASDAAQKHMIIISDGDPSPPPPELVDRFIQAGVSITMVAVFPHGGRDISVMQSIAATTGGRYYRPENPALLPSIFIKEAKTLRRSMVQNREVTPEAAFPSPILKGIDALPPLHGYVLTSIKDRARMVLQVPHEEEADPVLATWRYGVGSTGAFTSDLASNWGRDWLAWPHYQSFVRQLVTDLARVRGPGDLQLHARADGTQGVLTVEDYRASGGMLEVQALIRGPRGREDEVRLRQTAPRRYQARFPLWGMGDYQIAVQGLGGGRSETAVGGFSLPYSPEYLRFSSDPNALREIARQTGGRILEGTETGEQIFRHDRPPKRSSRPIFDWFLVALACLLPVDVGVRRVQFEVAAVKAWWRGSAALSTGTTTALLRRKQAGRDAEERPEHPRPTTEFPEVTSRPRERAELTAAPPPAAQAPSTTERLLARKRQRQSAPPGERDHGGDG